MVHAEYTRLRRRKCWIKEFRSGINTPSLQPLRRFPMATLRYVAYLAEDPAKLVDFYHRFLGTEELGRTADGDITISDGFYNLTFFRNRPELGEMQLNNGLHHIGLQVDDLE